MLPASESSPRSGRATKADRQKVGPWSFVLSAGPNSCLPDLQNRLGEAESTIRAQTTEIGRLEQRIKFFEEESQRHADTISMYRKRDENAAAARSYEEDAKRSREQELEAERRGYNEQLAGESQQNHDASAGVLIFL